MMKCRILRHFNLVFTVCQSTCFGVSSVQRFNEQAAVVDLLFIVVPIVLWCFVFRQWIVVQCLVPYLV